MYVLSLEESVIFDEDVATNDKADMLWQQFEVLKKELKDYDESLIEKSIVVSLSKAELYDAELQERIKDTFASHKVEIVAFSSLTRQGLDELQHQLREVLH